MTASINLSLAVSAGVSPPGTIVTNPAGGFLLDSLGAIWTLAPGAAGVEVNILRNGVIVSSSGILLEIDNTGALWAQNGQLEWWKYITGWVRQVGPPPIGPPPPPPPPPPPVTGWQAWWGLRALSGVTKALNVRGADGVTADINVLASGKLDVATATSFQTAHGALTVTRLYDQTGHGNDLVQPAVALQPSLSLSPLSLIFSGDSMSTASLSIPQPFALNMCASVPALASQAMASFGSGQNLNWINGNGYGGAKLFGPWNAVRFSDGVVATGWYFVGNQGFSLAPNRPYSITCNWNGASSWAAVNGSSFKIVDLSATTNNQGIGQTIGMGPTFSAAPANGALTLGPQAMTFYEGGIYVGLNQSLATSNAYSQINAWAGPIYTIDQPYELYGDLIWAGVIPFATGYNTMAIDIPTATFPNQGVGSVAGTVVRYNLTGTAQNVNGFPGIGWGTSGPTRSGTIPWNTIVPKQINQITTLKVAHNLTTVNSNSNSYDIIYDFFFSTGPNSGKNLSEFTATLKIGQFVGQTPSQKFGPVFVDSNGIHWQVYQQSQGEWHQYAFDHDPYPATDLLNVTFDLLGMFKFLVAQNAPYGPAGSPAASLLTGRFTGAEYFGGFELGTESFVNLNSTGSLTFNSMTVTYV